VANLVQVLNTAATYFRNGLYDESAELYEYALSTLNQQSERNAIDEAAVEQSLACLSMTRGNFGEAELKFQKAHALLSEYCAHNHPCRAVLLTNFAELHMLQGKFSIAESMLDSAWQILCQSNGDVLLEEKSATSSSLAECYLRLGKTDKAEEMLEASLAIAESAGQPASIAISLNNLAHFQISNSNMSEAEQLLIRAMDLLIDSALPRRNSRGRKGTKSRTRFGAHTQPQPSPNTCNVGIQFR
jgi:tetratricopeptide (TPR) repeat protein